MSSSSLLKMACNYFMDKSHKIVNSSKLYELKEFPCVENKDFTQKFEIYTRFGGHQSLIFISDFVFKKDLFQLKINIKGYCGVIYDSIIIDSEKIDCLFNEKGNKLTLNFGDLICHRSHCDIIFYFNKKVDYTLKNYTNLIALEREQSLVLDRGYYDMGAKFKLYFQEISLLKNNRAKIIIKPIENYTNYLTNIFVITEENAVINLQMFCEKDFTPREFTFKKKLSENLELHQINYNYIFKVSKIDQFSLTASKKIKKVYLQGNRILNDLIDFEIL